MCTFLLLLIISSGPGVVCSFFASQLLCSFWWMTLSHRQHRSVYSLGIWQPKWINGLWECSNRALGSIHQAEDAEREKLCFCFVLGSVCMFASPPFWFCVHWQHVSHRFHNCDSMQTCSWASITGLDSVDNGKKTIKHKDLTFPIMSTFPCQRLLGRDSKSLLLCYSAFSLSTILPLHLTLCPPLPSVQSLSWQHAGLISKQKVLSGNCFAATDSV